MSSATTRVALAGLVASQRSDLRVDFVVDRPDEQARVPRWLEEVLDLGELTECPGDPIAELAARRGHSPDDLHGTGDLDRPHHLDARHSTTRHGHRFVTGPYEFHADLPPERYRHRRTVEWFGRVPLADLPPGADRLYRQRSTLTRASIPGLEEFTDRVRVGDIGRPATARTRVSSGRSSTTTRRASPAAKHKPAPVVRERLCPGCGMIKHIEQFGPEGVCVDCA